MSIKEFVSTNVCDECGKKVVIRTEEDCRVFNEFWFSNLRLDLCPECRLSEKGAFIIEREKMITAEIIKNFRRSFEGST